MDAVSFSLMRHAEPAIDSNRSVIHHLRKSGIFRDYQRAFEISTGQSLALRQVGSFQPPLHGSRRMNPFCELMIRRSHSCAASRGLPTMHTAITCRLPLGAPGKGIDGNPTRDLVRFDGLCAFVWEPGLGLARFGFRGSWNQLATKLLPRASFRHRDLPHIRWLRKCILQVAEFHYDWAPIGSRSKREVFQLYS